MQTWQTKCTDRDNRIVSLENQLRTAKEREEEIEQELQRIKVAWSFWTANLKGL